MVRRALVSSVSSLALLHEGASQTPQRSERSQNGNTNEQYYMAAMPASGMA